jgi:hypothetical protein
MEKTENGEIDLNNIIRAIWKQKKLIIVVTLVCMVLGGVVMNFRSSVTYRSGAVMKVGKKVVFKESGDGIGTTSVTCSEESADPEKAICIKYDPGNQENSRYSIDAEMIDTSPMIRVIIEGPDRGTEKVLNEIVKRLIDDYNKIEEASVTKYKDAVTRLEAYTEVKQEEMAVKARTLKKINGIDNAALDRTAEVLSREEGVNSEDIYLMAPLLQGIGTLGDRIVEEEKWFSGNKTTLRRTQYKLTECRTFLRNLKVSNTKRIGEVKNSVVEPKRMRGVLMCGVVGLFFSLFLVFIIESVKERVERKKNLA